MLYGGTAVALLLGHRVSVDFDFFSSSPLDKEKIEASFAFVRDGKIIQEGENTLVVAAQMPSGPVKVSFFGGVAFGRLNAPLQTEDSVPLVASPEDILATMLKAILDRAETRDYRDISALIDSGTSLERSLAAFSKMHGRDPALPLRAIGFFKDGDPPSLPQRDQELLKAARDRVSEIPDVSLIPGNLAI